MEYYDIYVLLKKRDKADLTKLANDLIPSCRLFDEDAELTLNIENRELLIKSVNEFIEQGCQNSKSDGGVRIYGDENSNPNGGWIYFNSDGSTAFGITVEIGSCEDMLSNLKCTSQSQWGYIAGDCPPADSEQEFVKLCESKI